MKVVLRFEVGPASVIEHAMRSLTLGEELQGCGHEVIAATEGVSSFAERRSAAAVIEIREISNVRRSVRFVEQLAPDAIVFDGYGLGVTINALAADGHQLVVIDDNAELPVVDAAIVVNQNLHVGAATRFLLWPDYALLRPDVVRLGQEPACRERSSESRLAVLIARGRHRPAPMTALLVDLLVGTLRFNVIVALDVTYTDWGILDQVVRKTDRVELANPMMIDAFRCAELAVIEERLT